MKNKHRETFIRKLLHCDVNDIWYKVDNKFDRTSLGLKKGAKRDNVIKSALERYLHGIPGISV